MTVGGNQQVMLSVRFAEVQRSVIKELGFNTALIGRPGDLTLSLVTGVGIPADTFGGGGASLDTSRVTLQGIFDALEDKGVVKTLAEPNLIVLSGGTADFLAGGEFPIPVAQTTNAGGTTITIEFKQFGVSLAFSPTVLDGSLMNLVLNTEVSSIDSTVSVQYDNIVVPGLSVRRTTTQVELRDGQTFAIAGLLQDNFRDQAQQLPWLGDVPVLGTLFRSANYNRNQTELVVIITPRLVKPTVPGALAAPTDRFQMPTELDFFLKGELEGAPAAAALAQGGGLGGSYGYIVK